MTEPEYAKQQMKEQAEKMEALKLKQQAQCNETSSPLTPYGESGKAASYPLGTGLVVGKDYAEPARPNLREIVSMSYNLAEQASRNKSRYEELAYLLDKNPDVARILDLLGVGGNL